MEHLHPFGELLGVAGGWVLTCPFNFIQQSRTNGTQQRPLAASVVFLQGPGMREEVNRRGGSGETREKRRETRVGGGIAIFGQSQSARAALEPLQRLAEPKKGNSAQSREPLIRLTGRAAPGAEPSRAPATLVQPRTSSLLPDLEFSAKNTVITKESDDRSSVYGVG